MCLGVTRQFTRFPLLRGESSGKIDYIKNRSTILFFFKFMVNRVILFVCLFCLFVIITVVSLILIVSVIRPTECFSIMCLYLSLFLLTKCKNHNDHNDHGT